AQEAALSLLWHAVGQHDLPLSDRGGVDRVVWRSAEARPANRGDHVWRAVAERRGTMAARVDRRGHSRLLSQQRADPRAGAHSRQPQQQPSRPRAIRGVVCSRGWLQSQPPEGIGAANREQVRGEAPRPSVTTWLEYLCGGFP